MIKINLLRERSKVGAKGWAPSSARTQWIGIIILVAAAALVSTSFLYLSGRKQDNFQVREGLQAELAQLQAVRAQIERFKAEKEKVEERIVLVERLVANQQGPVRLMNSILASVPEKPRLWLVNVGQKNSALTVEGRTLDVPALAEFIERLERNAPFKRVELDFWEEEKDQESIRFQLSCEIEN